MDLHLSKRNYLLLKEHKDNLFLNSDKKGFKTIETTVVNKYELEEYENVCENLCEIQVEEESAIIDKHTTRFSFDALPQENRIKHKRSRTRIKHPKVTPRRIATNPDGLSIKFQSDIWPVNAYEEKENFFRLGVTPKFKLKGSPTGIEKMINHQNGQIKFNYFYEAKRILELSLRKYKTLDKFVLYAFGKPISISQGKQQVNEYLTKNDLKSSIHVIWSKHLICSAQMCTSKPKGKKRVRQYTLLIKSNHENTFIREYGIQCLLNHEIGTHYLRSYNDTLQVWYRNRHKYDITPVKSHDGMKTEEGLACIHTILNAKVKYICMPALLYYGSCMAEYLSFKQLFEHLSRYVKNPEQRWKHCMRIKRILKSTSDVGGYGKDQRYFEGAVEILRNIDNIDFQTLIRGKIIWQDVEKVQSMVSYTDTRVPNFMENFDEYIKNLREIATLNGLVSKPSNKFNPMSRKETMRILGVTEDQVKKAKSIPINPTVRCNQTNQFLPYVQRQSNEMYNQNRAGGDYPNNSPNDINNRQVVAKMCGCSLYSGIKYDVHLDAGPNECTNSANYHHSHSYNKNGKLKSESLQTSLPRRRQIPIIFELEMRKPII